MGRPRAPHRQGRRLGRASRGQRRAARRRRRGRDRRLGAHPRRLRDVEDRRGRGGCDARVPRAARRAVGAGARRPADERDRMSALAAAIEERERVLATFLEREQDALASACHAMARAFSRGGTLLAFGTGAAATDAAHVAVEFMHPVIVGKRALPALAPTNDPTATSAPEWLLRRDDIALGLSHGALPRAVADFLARARAQGALTIAFAGTGEVAEADYLFVVPSSDADIVQ